jgi:hypothetical protein
VSTSKRVSRGFHALGAAASFYLLLAFCLNGAEAKDNFMSYGVGFSSCGVWTKSQQTGRRTRRATRL